MKQITKLIFAAAIAIISGVVSAQEFKTGSIEFDTDLKTINAEAKADFGTFKTKLGGKYNITEKKIEELYGSVRMEPADIYLALELSTQTGKPLDEVVDVYEKNRGKGWGVIAKQLGIKPGSAEFHALKNSAKGKAMKGNRKGKGKNKGKGNNK